MNRIKPALLRFFRYVIKGVPVINVSANIVTIPQNNLLDGRVALITGGTSGIGYEIAKKYLQSGCSVIITGRDHSRINIACEKLKEETSSSNVCGFVLNNQSIPSTFHDVLLEIISVYKRLDILVNNAGVLTKETVSTENEAQYDQVLDTNLKGPFFLAQAVGNYFIENNIHGNILNIGSSSCLRPAASAYTLSKWGIRGLTLGLAKTLAPYGITVNGIAPGQTLTGMIPTLNKEANIYLQSVPLGRYILPEEIANMALFLVSEMGRSILGDMIYMTGGAGILTYEDFPYKF